MRILNSCDLSKGPDAPSVVRLHPGETATIERVFELLSPELKVLDVMLAPRALSDLEPEALQSALAAAESKHDLAKLLKDPKFAAFEARWRGLATLMQAGGEHEVEWIIVSTRAADWAGAVIDEGLKPAYADPAAAIDVVVVDHPVGKRASDVEALREVLTWAAAAATPVIAQANPAALGVTHAIHLPTLVDLDERIAAPKSSELGALRADPVSRWLTLTLGQWLSRSPHVEPTLPFFEAPTPERPETQPWASATWLAGAGVIRSLLGSGHAGGASGFAPAAVHKDLGVCRVPGLLGKDAPLTSTDVRFDDETATMLLRGGFTPILDRPQDGVAAFAFLSTFYRAPEVGLGLHRSASFAHQALTGAAARELARWEPKVQELGLDGDAADWLKGKLGDWHESIGLSRSDIDVAATADGLDVAIEPELVLDGHKAEIRMAVR